MKIDEILYNIPDEEILWDYSKYEKADPKTAFVSIWFLLAFFACLINLSVLFFMIVSEGFFNTLFSGYTIMLPFLLTPLWKWLYDLNAVRKRIIETRYVITQKGIYVQTGQRNNEQTEHYALEKVQSAFEGHSFDQDGKQIRNVSCRLSNGMAADSQIVLFDHIPDLETPIAIINEYAEKRKKEVKAKKLMSGGISDAEKYREPTPMHYTPRYQSKSRAESLLHACLPVETLIEEQAKTLAQNRRTRWTQKAEPNRQSRDSVVPVRDPDAAFFGNMRSMTPVPEKQPTFLNPDAAAEREMLDKMPDESVSELQAELFGANAEPQSAFADPTVNPLPELPEPQDNEQGQFMQRGF